MVAAIGIVGSTVFIPMMITRMMISLKRAASSRQLHLDLEVPSGLPTSSQGGHSSRTVDGILLSVFKIRRR